MSSGSHRGGSVLHDGPHHEQPAELRVQPYLRIPIEKSSHILNADALEIDGADVLAPDECSYVFGNSPFGGTKQQSPKQRSQVRHVVGLGGSGGKLWLRGSPAAGLRLASRGQDHQAPCRIRPRQASKDHWIPA